MQFRLNRRIVGWLRARLDVLPWQRVTDPRLGSTTSWSLESVLSTVVLGLIAGARSFRELEAMSGAMTASARRCFRLRGRLSDTTTRDLVARLSPDEVRAVLHAQIRIFKRQKALEPERLPWGVLSMDGKATAINAWDNRYVQKQGSRGVIRTITASLVSSPGCPCVDAFPIPAATNEMGAYLTALAALVACYGGIDLFRVVMYDAGACSEANARGTRALGLHYIMQLNDGQPTLFAEARRVLPDAPEHVIAFDDQKGHVRYRMRITRELEGWLEWDHLRTVVHVHRETRGTDGRFVPGGNRYFVSSLIPTSLDPRGWARLIRARWAVENNCHHTFDSALAEDKRTWFREHPVGALLIILLRRIAYNAMTLYRARTLRAEATRLIPWHDLVRQVFIALITATEATVNGLRARAPP